MKIALTLLLLSAAPIESVAPGIEYGELSLPRKSDVGPSTLHVVRIDPRVARIEVRAASAERGGNRTAGRWCEDARAVAAINAGMYAMDHSTHTGYLRIGEHVNSDRWTSYQSLLVLDPGATIIDRGTKDLDVLLGKRGTVIQNLRLIRNPANNVWRRSKKRWSEAAIAMDRRGRILFLFARSPYSMWRFNRMLMRLPLGIVAAQHAEGGPEASLSLRVRGRALDLAGSYETGFNENDDNGSQWRVPNVLVAIPPKSNP